MRSQNVGIVGLALVGVAALAPQQASANAFYHVELNTDMTATVAGGGTVTMENYWQGQATAGWTDAGGTSTFTNPTNTVSTPGSTASSEFDVLLEGVAIGEDRKSVV